MFRSNMARLLAVAALLCVTVGLASAHSELIRSEPAAGATLATAPQQVRIEFSQLLDPANSRITVVDAAGKTVSQGASEVPATNNKVMQVALQPNLAPGTYTVQWANLSVEDGEEFQDSFTFTIGGGASQPATTGTQAPAATQLPATGLTATPTGALVGVALLIVLVGLWLRSRNGEHVHSEGGQR